MMFLGSFLSDATSYVKIGSEVSYYPLNEWDASRIEIDENLIGEDDTITTINLYPVFNEIRKTITITSLNGTVDYELTNAATVTYRSNTYTLADGYIKLGEEISKTDIDYDIVSLAWYNTLTVTADDDNASTNYKFDTFSASSVGAITGNAIATTWADAEDGSVIEAIYELINVSGIGEKKLTAILDYITVGEENENVGS